MKYDTSFPANYLEVEKDYDVHNKHENSKIKVFPMRVKSVTHNQSFVLLKEYFYLQFMYSIKNSLGANATHRN